MSKASKVYAQRLEKEPYKFREEQREAARTRRGYKVSKGKKTEDKES